MLNELLFGKRYQLSWRFNIFLLISALTKTVSCSVLGRDSEYILAEAARDEQTSSQRLWVGYGTDGRFGPKLNLVSTMHCK
jgi:hypothetical protein